MKLSQENHSIGVPTSCEKDNKVVGYTLSRLVTPAAISEYETKLISTELLKQKINELYGVYGQHSKA